MIWFLSVPNAATATLIAKIELIFRIIPAEAAGAGGAGTGAADSDAGVATFHASDAGAEHL